MDSSSLAMLTALVLLVALSAYFSATETAFSSLNRVRLRNRAEGGDTRAALALSLSGDYDRLLSTILIDNNIVNITASTVGTVWFTSLLGVYGPTVATVVLTVVILVFGEISPKSLAKENPERFAMASAPLLRVLLGLLRPLNFLFAQWKRLLSRIFRTPVGQGITEEELLTLVSEAESEGGLDRHESKLIRSAIAFGDLRAGDLLTPRVDIVSIPETAGMDEVAARFVESGYSRLPVTRTGIDDIVGILHEKDFIAARHRGRSGFADCVVPAHYTASNARVDLLLRTMQREKAHMAVVVDEYGGTEGLVTLEDILEELVGEIWDEHDEAVEHFRRQEDDSVLVAADADLADLFELFSLRGGQAAGAVSSWVVDQLGRPPQPGDRFQAAGLDVTVTRAERRRLLEVRVRRAEEPEAAEAEVPAP